MDNYLLYIGVAFATILLPGPAVILTVNNSIQRGLLKSFAGILGIALAILLVAAISATSLGFVLASSVMAFTVVKILGAIYLLYLGLKMWRTKTKKSTPTDIQKSSLLKCFIEGFLVSISNPKAIFFMSIFPQFIDLSQAYRPQFILLATSFSALIVVVHSMYALFASIAKTRLSSSSGNTLLNKICGGIFVTFGVGLAVSSK
jgi:homoserine/homoserine lactone efflux protein